MWAEGQNWDTIDPFFFFLKKNGSALLCAQSWLLRREVQIWARIFPPSLPSLSTSISFVLLPRRPPSLFHRAPQVKGSSSCLGLFRIATIWSLTWMLRHLAIHLFSIYQSNMRQSGAGEFSGGAHQELQRRGLRLGTKEEYQDFTVPQQFQFGELRLFNIDSYSLFRGGFS